MCVEEEDQDEQLFVRGTHRANLRASDPSECTSYLEDGEGVNIYCYFDSLFPSPNSKCC